MMCMGAQKRVPPHYWIGCCSCCGRACSCFFSNPISPLWRADVLPLLLLPGLRAACVRLLTAQWVQLAPAQYVAPGVGVARGRTGHAASPRPPPPVSGLRSISSQRHAPQDISVRPLAILGLRDTGRSSPGDRAT
mmetsp:Transcript_29467/g.58448  ORF Transcript_29467/g.58448 Transcript_29467/m.58448 type:complete len:135 (+) Transcript_29467:536-940(+)